MTESRAITVVLAVGVLLIGLVLLIGVGPLAGLAFVYLVVVGQMLERVGMFTRIDEVWEDTDKALVNSAAAIEAVEELRAFLVEFRAALSAEDAAAMLSIGEARIPEYTADDSDLLDDDPTTQPIELPEPQGPPTEPVTEVAARQVRALMDNAAAEDEWRTRFTFADGGRR